MAPKNTSTSIGQWKTFLGKSIQELMPECVAYFKATFHEGLGISRRVGAKTFST